MESKELTNAGSQQQETILAESSGKENFEQLNLVDEMEFLQNLHKKPYSTSSPVKRPSNRESISTSLHYTDLQPRSSHQSVKEKRGKLYGRVFLEEDRFPRSLTKSPLRDMLNTSLHTIDEHPTSSRSYKCVNAAEAERLAGEIAFQLDRRILSYVFQNQKRLYGFTVRNIPEKIAEVSTNLLTGKVDMASRARMTERYEELMKRLSLREYIKTEHPYITEYIVNTYGVLKERPSPWTSSTMGYNNTFFLREVMVHKMPTYLLKDLLILLRCLAHVALQDKRPLFLF